MMTIDEYVDQVLATWHPLTDEQCETAAHLLVTAERARAEAA